MMKNTKILLVLLLTFTFNCFAFENSQVMTPINNMFDAMREHNGKKLLQQFTEEAILERVNKKNEVKKSDLSKFAEFVDKSPKHLDEQLFNITIQESGNLASAWTPFAFYLDGKLSHCGINSFQLIKQNEQWKIRYLMDNAFQGDCQKFIKMHKNSL
ncbi:MAG: hypothetical protein KC484_01235 [Colwelliaceae bacterium]|nr:hypothetical protein [Colwelliaceae bacterium]